MISYVCRRMSEYIYIHTIVAFVFPYFGCLKVRPIKPRRGNLANLSELSETYAVCSFATLACKPHQLRTRKPNT